MEVVVIVLFIAGAVTLGLYWGKQSIRKIT